MPLLRACLKCGQLSPSSYCDTHKTKPRTDKKREREARAYGTAWRKMSERARRLSPVCEHCGRTSDLTLEHTPTAMDRVEDGLPVRIEDCIVLCRSCNSKREWQRAG